MNSVLSTRHPNNAHEGDREAEGRGKTEVPAIYCRGYQEHLPSNSISAIVQVNRVDDPFTSAAVLQLLSSRSLYMSHRI